MKINKATQKTTAKTNSLNAARRTRRNGEKKAGAEPVPDTTDKKTLSKTPPTVRGGPRPAGREMDMVSKTSATARGGPRPGPGRERAPGKRRESAPRPPGAPRHEHSGVDLSHGGRTGSCACGQDFKQSPEAVRYYTKMGFAPRSRCFACTTAKKLRRQTASASSPAPEQTPAALPEQPATFPSEVTPAAPPGPATFPTEEHGAATAATDLAPQLAAAHAQVRELAATVSELHSTVAEMAVELDDLRQQTRPSLRLSPTGITSPANKF